MRTLLLHRMGQPFDEELRSLADWALQHWQMRKSIIQRSLELYREDYQGPFQDCLGKYQQAMENYWVNQVFKAGSLFSADEGIEKWIQLVFQYALQEMLLLALFCKKGKVLSLREVRWLVQKVTKFVEHDALYLHQVVEFIQMVQAGNQEGMVWFLLGGT